MPPVFLAEWIAHWVIGVGGNRGDLPTSVRSTSDSDCKFNALAYVAMCQELP